MSIHIRTAYLNHEAVIRKGRYADRSTALALFSVTGEMLAKATVCMSEYGEKPPDEQHVFINAISSARVSHSAPELRRRCVRPMQMKPTGLSCKRPSSHTRRASSGRANIAGVNHRGELRWNLGDIPGQVPGVTDISMQYGQTYHLNGWTIFSKQRRHPVDQRPHRPRHVRQHSERVIALTGSTAFQVRERGLNS
jgi:hypothetical protein